MKEHTSRTLKSVVNKLATCNLELRQMYDSDAKSILEMVVEPVRLRIDGAERELRDILAIMELESEW